MKSIVLFFTLICFGLNVKSQDLSKDEIELYDLIMQYREVNNLPKIPISKSLTYVAQTHANDLAKNAPDVRDCNLHSWSKQGNWSPCCYTPDHSKAKCMWDKPKELTKYQGTGYEIAYKTTKIVKGEDALDGWKKSSGHNALILNKGTWKKYDWKAIGIGIIGGYATVWFGKELDD